jgi:signal transduction histidine kinase
VEIGSLLESTLSVLERTVPPGIRLDADAPHDPAHAWVDPGRLRESLLNLAANACEAMPDGGPLGISVRRRGSPPQVEIRVTDHGQGIDPALLERVREPFFSTHSPRRGRGLGLSVVDGFARQSGGTLTIQSTCGVGTTVTLALPATPNG